MSRHIEIFRTVWNGITIEIRWEPRWLNLSLQCFDPAHLEIESIEPARAAANHRHRLSFAFHIA